jgi:Amt family ammonium transporter
VAAAFLNTNMAAAGGLLAALIVARVLFGKADLTMALNGALAGLVAITAEPLTPSALQATLIGGVGGVGGVLVVFSILGLDKLKLDNYKWYN